MISSSNPLHAALPMTLSKNCGDNSSESLDSRHGAFPLDTASEITDAKLQTGRLFLTVKWLKRPNGVQPANTVFTNSELKRHNPLLLCEFYERMLKVNIKQDTETHA